MPEQYTINLNVDSPMRQKAVNDLVADAKRVAMLPEAKATAQGGGFFFVRVQYGSVPGIIREFPAINEEHAHEIVAVINKHWPATVT